MFKTSQCEGQMAVAFEAGEGTRLYSSVHKCIALENKCIANLKVAETEGKEIRFFKWLN